MNAWSNPDTLASDDVTNMALFLEKRAQAPDQQFLHAVVVEALDPQAGARVLDLGCGTGVIARRLAERVGLMGLVVGLDLSQAMLDVARSLGKHPALQFERGDAQALNLPASHFDYALAARLLMHVSEPHVVLRELGRVVRRRGRLALLERDWGTFAVDHADRIVTRRILDWRCDHIDGNNWAGRQLVRLCTESGWRVCEVRPMVIVAHDEHTTLLGSLRHAAQLALQHNVITAEEHDGWLNAIERRLAAGSFFATINEYLVIAERP